MQTIIGLVSAGIGIAIVPSSLQNLQRTGVVYQAIAQSAVPKAIAQQTPFIETAVVWRGEEEIPVLREFLKVVSPAKRLNVKLAVPLTTS